ENRQPETTSTDGRTAVSPRTVVDFAVPFSPRTSTPPMPGEIALRMRARRMSSMPTTALNGNNSCADGVYTPQPFTRQVSAPAVSDDHWAAARWHGCRCPGSRSLTASRDRPQWRDRPGLGRVTQAAPVFHDSRSSAIVSQRYCTLLAVPNHPVTVVGIGADGWDGLSPSRAAALSAAQVIIGGPRQLDLLPEAVTGKRVPLPSPLLPGLEVVLGDHADTSIVVLASGDPMLHGIGSTLVRLLGADRVTVLPHPSSVSLATARLGWPLDDVEVVSAVGRPLDLLHPPLQPGRRVLVLVAEPSAAADIRTLLKGRGFGSSPVTVLADLGGDAESVAPAEQAPHSRLAIVAIECVADPDAMLLPRTPGLPDSAFEQDGQITKHEIRAVALAALGPVPGQLLWDVGAGSGSIAIEWMRVHPASRAIAVEPRAERRDRIARNASALGVPGLQIVAGTAPAALVDLP